MTTLYLSILFILFFETHCQLFGPAWGPPPPPIPWQRRDCNLFDSIDGLSGIGIFNQGPCKTGWNRSPPPPPNVWQQTDSEWPQPNQNPGWSQPTQNNRFPQANPNTRLPQRTQNVPNKRPNSVNTNPPPQRIVPAAPTAKLPTTGSRPSNGQDPLNILGAQPNFVQTTTTQRWTQPVVTTTRRPIVTTTQRIVLGPNGKADPNSDAFIPPPPA